MLRVRPKSLRLLSTVAVAASVAAGLFYLYHLAPDGAVGQSIAWPVGRPLGGAERSSGVPDPDTPVHPPQPLPLPDDYLDDEAQSTFCTDRFSTQYLYHLRDTGFQYCDPASSASTLTCFHSHTASDQERDSLCIAKSVRFDADAGRFALPCTLREPDANASARGVIPYQAIRSYWYDTGARLLLDRYMRWEKAKASTLPLPSEAKRDEQAVDDDDNANSADNGPPPGTPRYVLLVKREGALNPWHSLLEIWSMYMTLDVLRMAADPTTGDPYFSDDAAANTQVVVLDDHADGPYFALWTHYAARPPIRLHQIPGNPEALRFLTAAPEDLRVLVPLAGASNPLWQNDWAPRDCTGSDTMRAFVRRVLAAYDVQAEAEAEAESETTTPPLRLTFIDRRDANTRRLVRQDALLDAVRAAHPSVAVQAVDFGSLPFAEQLRIVRATDVLVGVHGAGLTHTLFLPERTSAVVEIQPADMGNVYMGFRNVANMRSVAYFRTTAQPATEEPAATEPAVETATETERAENNDTDTATTATPRLKVRASWHTENFDMATDAFVATVGAAIQAVSNKKLRTNAVA